MPFHRELTSVASFCTEDTVFVQHVLRWLPHTDHRNNITITHIVNIRVNNVVVLLHRFASRVLHDTHTYDLQRYHDLVPQMEYSSHLMARLHRRLDLQMKDFTMTWSVWWEPHQHQSRNASLDQASKTSYQIGDLFL
ncbi:hypothetical protein Tco_0151394 [Tanacetum coccineum]